MTRSALRLFVLIGMLAILHATAATLSAEPSMIELRQENERLRDQVAELDARLTESRRRIARLEEIIRDLRDRIDQVETREPIASPGDERLIDDAPEALPPVEEDRFVIPDNPMAAPDALYQTLVREYEDAFSETARETEREAARYILDVRRWARQAMHKHRGQVEWMVRVLDATPTEGRDTEFTLQIVDGETGEPWGRPFRMLLAGRDAGRLQADPSRTLWVMSGVFSAQPLVNPDRPEPALFDASPLIGPYVEFHYNFMLKSLRPHQGEEFPAAGDEEPRR